MESSPQDGPGDTANIREAIVSLSEAPTLLEHPDFAALREVLVDTVIQFGLLIKNESEDAPQDAVAEMIEEERASRRAEILAIILVHCEEVMKGLKKVIYTNETEYDEHLAAAKEYHRQVLDWFEKIAPRGKRKRIAPFIRQRLEENADKSIVVAAMQIEAIREALDEALLSEEDNESCDTLRASMELVRSFQEHFEAVKVAHAKDTQLMNALRRYGATWKKTRELLASAGD